MNSYEKIIKIMREQGTKGGRQQVLVLGSMKSDTVCEISGMEFDFEEGELIIADHLTEREIEVSFDGWETEETSGGSGDDSFASHTHGIKEEKSKLTLHTALKAGDMVLCAPISDEQYMIIERMVEYVPV